MARIGKEKKEAIKQEILDVSKNLFFELGYDKTSTSKIAKAVGIAEGTVFNYFKTKADILVEVVYSEYDDALLVPNIDGLDQGIVELYVDFYLRAVDKLLKFPKKLILEMSFALLNASRKKPGMIKKLAEMDFKYLDDLTVLTQQLMDKGILKPTNARFMAEGIFSVIMYELMIYLYEEQITKEMMYDRIRDKVAFELEHRLTEE